MTADDYARRARAHADVGRAWAVPGRLEGIAWNGLATGTAAAIAVDENAPAVTLVVEWAGHKPASPTQAQTDEFLRDVLQQAIGPEVRGAVPGLAGRRQRARATTDGMRRGRGQRPRRGTDPRPGHAGHRGRRGRRGRRRRRTRQDRRILRGPPGRERLPAAPSGSVDGPWPRIEQLLGGWIPGDPVRFTEVVSAIVANPEVLGVEELAMKIDGAANFVPQSAGRLEIPRNAIPVLAGANRLKVRFSLTLECGDA